LSEPASLLSGRGGQRATAAHPKPARAQKKGSRMKAPKTVAALNDFGRVAIRSAYRSCGPKHAAGRAAGEGGDAG
ncbi:MAG: hypothetical protein ACKOUM_08180, partial [Sphingopyxis sp.]